MTSVVVGSNTTSKPLSDCQKLMITKGAMIVVRAFQVKGTTELGARI